MRSITFVALHAYPDPEIGAKRVSELANFVAVRGWAVSMVCCAGPFRVEGGRLHQSIQRIDIPMPRTIYSYLKPLVPSAFRGSRNGSEGGTGTHGVGQHAAGARGSLLRATRAAYLDITLAIDPYKRWSWRAFLRILRETRSNQPDVLLCSGPAWSAVVAAVAAACIRRIPIVIDFRDPWCNNEYPVSAITAAINHRMEKWCVNRCALVTCTTDSIAVQLRERYPHIASRIVRIRNGFDAADAILSPAPTGRLHILFAGSIYLNRSPMPLLEGLRLLLRDPEVDSGLIKVTMVGACRDWNGINLREWICRNSLDDIVTIGDSVSRDDVRRLTMESNVLANFSQGQKAMIPAKLFEQIAARRTVLLFAEADSESALCASTAPNIVRLDDDPAAVKEALLRVYRSAVEGEKGSTQDEIDISCFSRDGSNKAFLELIERLASSRHW